MLSSWKNIDIFKQKTTSTAEPFNSLRPRWNWPYLADGMFKYIFWNENIFILIKIKPKLIPNGPINNILTIFQIMARHSPGDMPLSESMMIILLMHICVTQPHWVKPDDQVLISLWMKIVPVNKTNLLQSKVLPEWIGIKMKSVTFINMKLHVNDLLCKNGMSTQ